MIDAALSKVTGYLEGLVEGYRRDAAYAVAEHIASLLMARTSPS